MEAGEALDKFTDGPDETLEGHAAIKDFKKKKIPPCLAFQISLKSSSVPGRLIFSLRRMIFQWFC